MASAQDHLDGIFKVRTQARLKHVSGSTQAKGSTDEIHVLVQRQEDDLSWAAGLLESVWLLQSHLNLQGNIKDDQIGEEDSGLFHHRGAMTQRT